MPETLSCPNCGAPLDYKGNDPIIRCPYCSTSVVVPDNLRAKPSFSSKPSNFTLSGSGDMAGLLQKARRMKDVKDLAQSGKMDEAISLYREITGVGEFEANTAVHALSLGQPITLTGFSTSDVSAQMGQFTTPSIQIDARGVGQAASRMGCLVGCFVTGLTLFILAVTLIPIFATTIPLFMGGQDFSGFNLTGVPNVLPGFAQQELSFGGEGTGAGLFTDPRAIAVDAQTGNIFVADYQGGRVQSFDASGKFLTQWKVGDKKTIITSMTADHKGNIFVCAISNIYRYDAASGEVVGTIKADDSVTYHYDDITAAADGTLYAIGGGENIVHMDIDGKILMTVPDAISTVTDDAELGAKIAVDGEGNIYVLGTFNDAVFKFNPDGKYVNRFGGDGDATGQFRAPSALAVDGQGRIYVSDFKGIQVFDNDGRYLDVFDPEGFAFGMFFDDQGKLYVASNANKVLKFNIVK